MKVLWICHAKIIDGKNIKAASWINSLLPRFVRDDNVALYFLTVSPEARALRSTQISDGFWLFTLPARTKNFQEVSDKTTEEITQVIKEIDPDIIQVFGAEFGISLSVGRAVESLGINTRLVIWLQGLCSMLAREYNTAIPERIVRRYTIRDFLRKDNLFCQQNKIRTRGVNEIEAISYASHVIGRTEWDRACVEYISPHVKYYHCDDTLRDEFYSGSWEYKKCRKNSLFISQSDYPIKGLHVLLMALPFVIQRYPDLRLYIAGENLFERESIRDKLAVTSYSLYLESLIKQNKLDGVIEFTGFLTAEEMKQQYLSANVFVLPSMLENSPNSLAEAMILGVPCVASDVGGVSSMLKHKQEGFLYDKTDAYILAHWILTILDNPQLAAVIGNNARKSAIKRHDPEKNHKQLMSIYDEVLECSVQ